MDPINANPYLSDPRLLASQRPPAAANAMSNSGPQASQGPAGPTSDFSTMFDDDALLKLQGNLEAIAQLAEKSLKQINRS